MNPLPMPPMPTNWEPTRTALHSYAKAVGAIARAHAVPHPKWWHISLKVRSTGLVTETMPLPGGGTFELRMDLRSHEVVMETSTGQRRTVSMKDGPTGTQFGRALISVLDGFGIEGEYMTDKFESDETHQYVASDAEMFFSVLVNVNHNLEIHRLSLDGAIGPTQIWPHRFDIAFEWYGTRMVSHEEQGETTLAPAQLNLGFYPAGRPYFYSNPWPFESAVVTAVPLPAPAQWNTEGWEGSILYYDDLLESQDAPHELLAYAKAVFEAAAPTLQV